MARERARSLRSRALSFLARREHSRAELARKLAPHLGECDDVAALLDELAAKGWLSDARFAEQAIRSKARRFGPRKLAYDLRAKGVDDEAIAAGLRAAGRDGVSSIEHVWKSRFRARPADEREKARHARFLMGRGFAADEVFRFLAQLGVTA
jgi:regulatory protein